MNGIQVFTQTLLQRLEAFGTSAQTECPRLAKLAQMTHHGMTLIPIEIWYLVFMFLAASLLIGLVVAPLAGFSTYVERRVAARMQARIGCNRVGPEGLLQFMADGIKLVLKEDNIPKGADRLLFRLAPYLVIAGAFMSFVTIPFGKYLIASDLNIGVFYLIGVSSFVVVGILLAGWASNNKWSLLGAMRSAAQIVSYEIPLGLALLIPVLWVGSLSLQDLNAAQSGGFRDWLIWTAPPAAIIAFFVYFISALAELNRTPFDLPEAESELVSGYNTEYSGMRWGLFFVGEYANMFLVGAIAVTTFLGGWQPSKMNIPFLWITVFFTFFFAGKTLSYLVGLVPQLIRGRSIYDLIATVRPLKFKRSMMVLIAVLSIPMAAFLHMLSDFWLVQLVVFISKAYFFVLVMVWIRWTLPRYRVDHMMSLCWKKLVPLGFGCVAWTALYIWIRHG